ncbi:MAG TPA: copper chaperone PCu(A)C [Trebonia sp.]|nr:copper chaperone PCu(A)C [Trebonia sp.]
MKFGSLARACCVVAVVLIPLGALAGCGSEEPDNPGPGVPASYAPAEQDGGVTDQVGGLVDVITARIPQPGAGATEAQLEMTLAVTTPGTPAALTAISTPAATSAVLLTNGHSATRISVPLSAGTNVQIGPPSADEILLKGLREKLKLGQTIPVTMTFGKAASTTLKVPVTEAP